MFSVPRVKLPSVEGPWAELLSPDRASASSRGRRGAPSVPALVLGAAASPAAPKRGSAADRRQQLARLFRPRRPADGRGARAPAAGGLPPLPTVAFSPRDPRRSWNAPRARRAAHRPVFFGVMYASTCVCVRLCSIDFLILVGFLQRRPRGFVLRPTVSGLAASARPWLRAFWAAEWVAATFLRDESDRRGGVWPIFVGCCVVSRERILPYPAVKLFFPDAKLVDNMTTSMADPLDFGGEQQRFDQLHHQQLEQKLFNTGPRASRTLPTATVSLAFVVLLVFKHFLCFFIESFSSFCLGSVML